ncbi:MAG: V-type ATP synthase subunit F [Oscillospiraceae bacterium]|nr:V-type ATP synthase subunit F [Oscillospiraceae bacterium]
MRFFLISDNVDTAMGMRLAGIEGVVVHEREEILDALHAAMEDKTVGIILMTEKTMDLVEDEVNELRLTHPEPIISEIPDRHGTTDVTASISRYVKDAIGIEL